MLRNFIFIVILFAWDLNAVNAQDVAYFATYSEDVYANYNILSVSKNESFKHYNTIFFTRVAISFLDRNHIAIKFVNTDSTSNAVAGSYYGVMLTLDKQKKIDSLFFDTTVTREQEIRAKLILSAIQYLNYRDIAVNKKSEEEFIDGKYNSRYFFEKNNKNATGNSKFVKIKKEISTAETDNSLTQKIIVDAFLATYRFSKSTGFLNQLQISSKKHQKIQNKIIAFIKSKFDLKLANADTINDNKQMVSFGNRKVVGTRIFNPIDIFLRSKLISQRIIQNDNLDSLKEKLSKTSNMSFEQRVHLSSQFRAWIFLHPDKNNDIKTLLESFVGSSDEYNLLIDAIVNTYSADAQDMFAKIIEQNKTSEEMMRLLIPKASGVALPTDLLLRTLLALKINSDNNEIASMSGLGLSNLLHSISKDHSFLYDSIARVLYAYYTAHNKTNENIIQFLLEAGNSGDEVYLKNISAFIHNDNGEIRKESLYALRFMRSTKADSLLVTELSKKPDSASTSWLYVAIKNRVPSAYLQKSLVTYIRSNVKTNPKACELFIEYLNGYIDEVPTIRKTLLSLKSIPQLKDRITEMISVYDNAFAIFKD
ncbi:MAG: hypothetical protein JST75_12290 [Bacteroidetes bacterium]|nr:hypothetical protein [Bacteroidota bacterium]